MQRGNWTFQLVALGSVIVMAPKRTTVDPLNYVMYVPHIQQPIHRGGNYLVPFKALRVSPSDHCIGKEHVESDAHYTCVCVGDE